MYIIVFLLLFVHLVSGGTHSLWYIYTAVTPGINFPEVTAVGRVDGEPFLYYDNNIRRSIPRTKWIQKIDWKSETEMSEREHDTMDTVMKSFNHTEGLHTLQYMYGCELDDNGTTRGFRQFGYDGEDFITLDFKTLTYTAAKRQAEITKNKWESNRDYSLYWKNYLKNECIDWLKKYGREILERKVRPKGTVFQRQSPSSEVVCHATGFFPKLVMINWQKDGKDMIEDVDLSETFPNQDGTFQKRSVLKVSAEELQKHKYTCVIHHSSLEEELVLHVSERRILTGGAPIGIIIGVVVGLIVLIAVIGGLVVWKKKKSDYSTAASEEQHPTARLPGR